MSEMRLMIDWDLTAAECRALLALHAAPGHYCSHRELHAAISRKVTAQDIVKVIICHIRRKTAKYGVKIVTKHAHGYRLAGSSVAIINRAMGVDVHLQNPDLVGA